MIPHRGGPELPDAPLCLPSDHKSAFLYVHQIAKALDQPGWSARQRLRLRAQYRKWVLRAEGRDGYFEKYGSFPRIEGTAPPTTTDWIVAKWRKRARPETPLQTAVRLGRGSIRKQIQIMKRLETKGRVPARKAMID